MRFITTQYKLNLLLFLLEYVFVFPLWIDPFRFDIDYLISLNKFVRLKGTIQFNRLCSLISHNSHAFTYTRNRCHRIRTQTTNHGRLSRQTNGRACIYAHSYHRSGHRMPSVGRR